MKWTTFMGIGILGGVILFVLTRNDDGRIDTVATQPVIDSSFAPVQVHQVKPDLLGRYDHPAGVRIPKNLKSSDIDQVVVIRPNQDSAVAAPADIPIIIDRQGNVYADTALISSIDRYEYTPPFLAFDPAVGLGVGYSSNGPEADVTISFVRAGRLRIPAMAVGTRSAGIGGQVAIYKTLHAGLYVAVRYKDPTRHLFKANLIINL